MTERWNRNTHYHPVILALILDATQSVRGRLLDVGCGEGHLARTLARRTELRVSGIDAHEASIHLAQSQGGDVNYVAGDFFEYPFEVASWEAIVSVAALHHMDFRSALARASLLLRPGGVFAAIGLARSRLPDLPLDVLAKALSPFLRRGRPQWRHPSPICWPPPLTYNEVREAAAETLPGVVYRRHLLFRYSLCWRKPE